MDMTEFQNDPSPTSSPKQTVVSNVSLGAQEGLNYRFSEGEDRESGLSFLQWTVLISVGIHVLLVVIYFFLLRFYPSLVTSPPPVAQEAPQVLSTRMLTMKDLQRLQGKSRNIVDTSKGKTVENPKDLAPYLGERTQRVDKETVARSFGNATGGERAPPSEGDEAETGKAGKDGEAKTPPKRRVPPGNFGFGQLVPEEKVARGHKKKNLREGDGNPYGNHDMVNKDAVLSTETLLNTDEYKYASFFNRLKSEVAPRWEPLVQSIISDRSLRILPGIYSTQTRMTINQAGEIVRVDVTRPSGAPRFDEAAKSSIYQVLRLQNLPQALQDGDGMYRIELGFTVNLTNGGGIQTDYVPDPRLPER